MAGKKESITALTMGLSVGAPRTGSRILRGNEVLKREPKVDNRRRAYSRTLNTSRSDEAVQEVTGGLLSIGASIFSRP
jgi:hypothetical protein